jgi:hypothetical protein
LAGEAARLRPNSSEPAALPARKVARLDGRLTLELGVPELGRKGWSARGFDDGRSRWSRRLGGTARTMRDVNRKRLGSCIGA